MKRLCGEYVARPRVSQSEADEISKQTVDQSMDVSGEWQLQRHGRLTASRFGKVSKHRASTGYTRLTTGILYSKHCETKAMRYGLVRESEAHNDYLRKKVMNNPLFSVTETGLHIDTTDHWLAASPDGLVTDPSESAYLNGLLEIKCPLLAESTSIHNLCTMKEHKSSFCLSSKGSSTFYLKRNHNYYYQIQGQLHVTRLNWCD